MSLPCPLSLVLSATRAPGRDVPLPWVHSLQSQCRLQPCLSHVLQLNTQLHHLAFLMLPVTHSHGTY